MITFASSLHNRIDNRTEMDEHELYMQRHLRAVQLKELAILKEIHKVCIKHQIEYWLDGGTILGALRHGGFIPWDDDIDIAMRKEDVPRFVEAATKDLPSWLYVQTPETDVSRLPMIKIRDNNSFLVEPNDDFFQSYPKGVYVDIFPFEPYPSVSRQFCKRVLKGYCTANGIMNAKHYYSLRSFAEFFWFGGKRLCTRVAWALACAIRPHHEYYGNSIETNGYGIMHKQVDIFPVSTIQFEGETFMAPARPHDYTTNIYGDYMKLPPENQRVGHAVFYAESL